MKIMYKVLLLLVCLTLSACGQQEQISYEKMEYADLLRIHKEAGWIGVEVLDAWQKDKLLHRYLLVPRGEEVPKGLPEGTLVRTPLERVVAFSSVHGGLLCDMGCADALAGICDADFVLSDSLCARLSDGRLLDMGSSMQVDMERMLKVRPDAFFVSPFENAGYGSLSGIGVPLIECEDYMETSALGRAEWMKFYGLLMGHEAVAESLFAEVKEDYLKLCELVEHAENHPSLLCDLKQGGAWYVPGGNSYIGRLFSDAGADYLFADREESGSVALSFEKVLSEGQNADIWVMKYGNRSPLTYESLVKDYPLYAKFRPWKERRIYGCNTYEVPFYEEVPFHPNLLLRDMVKIFYPQSLPQHRLRYYFPLSESASSPSVR